MRANSLMMIYMNTRIRPALLSLAAAGALWGLTVPLSKLALTWLGPGWLTVARFGVAAPLLAFAGRRGLREALTPRVALGGAVGFGAVIVLQNAGIDHTSVSHAAVIVGVVPVLVALFAAGLGRGAGRASDWAGYALALMGIALVAGDGGGGATPLGDGLVLASVVLSAGFIVGQPRLLAGRDAAAVTAVQFAAGAVDRAPGRRVDGRDAGGPGARRPGARARRAGHGRDAAAVLAVRVRTGSGPGRAGGRVRQPRARRRRHRGLARVQRPGSGLADRRRRRGARRDRPEHAAGEPEPLRLGSAAG